MLIEQSNIQSENNRFSSSPEHYQFQGVFLKDHDCFGSSLNYSSEILINKQRLVLETSLNYSLQYDEALLLGLTKKKIQDFQDQIQIQKQSIPFSRQEPSLSHIKKLIQKLYDYKISIFTQAGLPEKENQRKSIKDQLTKGEWITYFSRRIKQNLDQLIYDDFNLNTFLMISYIILNLKNQISKSSFLKIIKAQGYSYKMASTINFKATTSVNKSKQQLYAITILFNLKEQKELIYFDETGQGKDYIRPKIQCKKNSSYYIDRADFKTRINIIGAWEGSFYYINAQDAILMHSQQKTISFKQYKFAINNVA